jgi:hypothetical protein
MIQTNELIEHRARIKTAVEKYLDRNAAQAGIAMLILNPEAREHITSIGTSVLMNVWGIGPEGGSFVRALVNNDLKESYSRADHINQKAIMFYVMLMVNQTYVY